MKKLDLRVSNALLDALEKEDIFLIDVNRNNTYVFQDKKEPSKEYRVYQSGYVRKLYEEPIWWNNSQFKTTCYQLNKTYVDKQGNTKRMLCSTLEEALIRLLEAVRQTSNTRNEKHQRV